MGDVIGDAIAKERELHDWRRDDTDAWRQPAPPDDELAALCASFSAAMTAIAATALVECRLVRREVLVPTGGGRSRRQRVDDVEIVERAAGWPLVRYGPTGADGPPGRLEPGVWLYSCVDGRLRWGVVRGERHDVHDGGPLRGPTLRDALLRHLGWDRPAPPPRSELFVERPHHSLDDLRALAPYRLAVVMARCHGVPTTATATAVWPTTPIVVAHR